MQTSATNSALEVAAWLLSKARNERQILEHEKLQHLLFLAQFHYLSTHPDILLMPSLFVLNHGNCIEPNVSKLHNSGLLADFPIRFDNDISEFLNKIWKIYAQLSLHQLKSLIKEHLELIGNSDYPNTIINFQSLIENYKTNNKNNKIYTQQFRIEQTKISSPSHSPKIMLSQNGPVVVSKWEPRKLSGKTPNNHKI